MKETFYFSHDYNTRDDEKIMNMLADMWMEWYGLYWTLIETLVQNNWTIKLDSIKWLWYKLRCDNTLITQLLHNYNLFIIDEEKWIFYNKRLLTHLDKRQELKDRKSEAGKKGMAKRWGNNNTTITPVITEDNTTITNDNKVKESKVKESKVKEIVSIDLAIADKSATLESYIKQEFELDFITEVYNKYWMNKKDFQEECEWFVEYWKEKSPNWKKERWEKEKTFDPKLRFRTWMKNNKKWSTRTIVNSEDEEKKIKLADIERRKALLFNKI